MLFSFLAELTGNTLFCAGAGHIHMGYREMQYKYMKDADAYSDRAPTRAAPLTLLSSILGCPCIGGAEVRREHS